MITITHFMCLLIVVMLRITMCSDDRFIKSSKIKFINSIIVIILIDVLLTSKGNFQPANSSQIHRQRHINEC